MHRLAALSLGNRALIALITVFVAVFGVITMGQLKQELIPALEFPRISVVASQPGASPEVIDKQVAQPLEGALQAVEGLESSSSTSQTGFTTISLSFVYGTDLDRARAQVDKAISNAKSTLPADVEPSAFAGSISDFPIVYLAVSGGEDLNSLRSDVERLVLPKLSKIDGRAHRGCLRRQLRAHRRAAGHRQAGSRGPVRQRPEDRHRGRLRADARRTAWTPRALTCQSPPDPPSTHSMPSSPCPCAAPPGFANFRTLADVEDGRGHRHLHHPHQRSRDPGRLRDQEAGRRHRGHLPRGHSRAARAGRAAGRRREVHHGLRPGARSSSSRSTTSPSRACWAWASPWS